MQSMTQIVFEVFGEQKPQGSKIPQAIYGKDKKPVILPSGRVLTVVRNDNPDLMAWRGAIAWAARQVYNGPLLQGALKLTIQFYRPRPKGHFGTGKNADTLKPSAPKYPITKPDNTKLTRAVEDALKGVVWKDDSQVVLGVQAKDFGECFRTHVIIETLP
jgi:Holliday junction resolvase RusA-like endonuclease